jgi:hypothetical protein
MTSYKLLVVYQLFRFFIKNLDVKAKFPFPRSYVPEILQVVTLQNTVLLRQLFAFIYPFPVSEVHVFVGL